MGTFSFRAGFEEIGEERFRGTSILRGRFSRWKPVSPTSPASQNTTNQSVRLAFRPAPNLEDSWLKLNDDDGFWKELRSDKPTGTRVAERPFGGPKPIAEALGAYQQEQSIPVIPKRDRGQRSDLGILLVELGNIEGARQTQIAIDSDHAEMAPTAAYNLGILLFKKGDIAGSDIAFRTAIGSGHAGIASTAAAAWEYFKDHDVQR